MLIPRLLGYIYSYNESSADEPPSTIKPEYALAATALYIVEDETLLIAAFRSSTLLLYP